MRTTVVCLLLALTVGCKDKPKRREPPANIGSASAQTGSGGMKPAPDLILPRGDGSPPKKTTKPHTKADYERLAKLEFPGFTADVRTVGEKVFEVRQKTKDHPRLWAVVTIQHCMDCLPMELPKWQAKSEDLKVTLEILKDAKDLTWQVGQTQLNGQPVMYTYQVATGTTQAEGGGEYSFTNAYIAYYNDGVNQIRVIGQYKDDPVSKEDLLKLAPKPDLEALALSFLDAYTQAW